MSSRSVSVSMPIDRRAPDIRSPATASRGPGLALQALPTSFSDVSGLVRDYHEASRCDIGSKSNRENPDPALEEYPAGFSIVREIGRAAGFALCHLLLT